MPNLPFSCLDDVHAADHLARERARALIAPAPVGA